MLEDARLIGSTAYIYEAGCAVMMDGEETVLIGDFRPEDGRTRLRDDRRPGRARAAVRVVCSRRSSTTRPGTPSARHSHLFRGKIDVAEANAILEREGHGALKLIDNGAIVRQMDGVEGRAHAYHLMPAAASKANAVVFHMRARGYAPEECIAIGDSVEDLAVAEVVGRFFVPANGPERDPGLREATRPLLRTSPSPRARWATASTRRSSRLSPAPSRRSAEKPVLRPMASSRALITRRPARSRPRRPR